MLWVYENGTGLRVSASKEDAVAMVADGSTHSCLWPRGKPDQEAAELERMIRADYYSRGVEMPVTDSLEVHLQRQSVGSEG